MFNPTQRNKRSCSSDRVLVFELGVCDANFEALKVRSPTVTAMADSHGPLLAVCSHKYWDFASKHAGLGYTFW